jgi:hypothetical protein
MKILERGMDVGSGEGESKEFCGVTWTWKENCGCKRTIVPQRIEIGGRGSLDARQEYCTE